MTAKELHMVRLDMEAGQSRCTERVEAKLDKLDAEAQQNSAQLKVMANTVDALERNMTRSSDTVHELAQAVQKMVNHTSGLTQRRPFTGRCHNCQNNGHMARDCPEKPKRRAINAVSEGTLANDEFLEQYGSQEIYINCLCRGVQETDESEPTSPAMFTTHE